MSATEELLGVINTEPTFYPYSEKFWMSLAVRQNVQTLSLHQILSNTHFKSPFSHFESCFFFYSFRLSCDLSNCEAKAHRDSVVKMCQYNQKYGNYKLSVNRQPSSVKYNFKACNFLCFLLLTHLDVGRLHQQITVNYT